MLLLWCDALEARLIAAAELLDATLHQMLNA